MMSNLQEPLYLEGTLTTIKGMSGQLGNPRSIGGTLQRGAVGVTCVYYDTTENWEQKGHSISERGAIYVYSDYFPNAGQGLVDSIPGIKVGDGINYISDLGFITDTFTVTDYATLENKPSINEVPLASGNNDLADLGVAKATNRDISKLFT